MPELDDLHQQIRFCKDCELYREANNPVPGEGSSEADLMLIGEGPGYQEDKQGRPFVGPAGKFLNELLALIGLRREDVFIANMVKHRLQITVTHFLGRLKLVGNILRLK